MISQNSGSRDFSYEVISFKIIMCCIPQEEPVKLIKIIRREIPITIRIKFLKLVF